MLLVDVAGEVRSSAAYSLGLLAEAAAGGAEATTRIALTALAHVRWAGVV